MSKVVINYSLIFIAGVGMGLGGIESFSAEWWLVALPLAYFNLDMFRP